MSTEIRQRRKTVEVLPLAIKHWRQVHLKWSQEEAAERTSRTEVAKAAGIRVSASTFAMIEVGKRQPSLVVADAIAEAFGVPLGMFGRRIDLGAGEAA